MLKMAQCRATLTGPKSANKQSKLVTSSATKGIYLGRKKGVPESVRCVTDDQFAVGRVEQMDGFSSLFPDFNDYIRLSPWWRSDAGSHPNERGLTAHMHYRGVQFNEEPLGHVIHQMGPKTCRNWARRMRG